jgi:signal transduction histidine kinase
VDLSVIAREAVDRWAGAVAAEEQQLELEAATPARTLADPTDLTHVADNLIENALRYCPPGISITVSTAARNGEVALLVADTGPGIPAADRERIFERFYRGANGRAAHAGTGLGLAIVAEIVRRWGGDVRLLEGPGTRIEAVFPSTPTVSSR